MSWWCLDHFWCDVTLVLTDQDILSVMTWSRYGQNMVRIQSRYSQNNWTVVYGPMRVTHNTSQGLVTMHLADNLPYFCMHHLLTWKLYHFLTFDWMVFDIPSNTLHCEGSLQDRLSLGVDVRVILCNWSVLWIHGDDKFAIFAQDCGICDYLICIARLVFEASQCVIHWLEFCSFQYIEEMKCSFFIATSNTWFMDSL